MSNKCILKNTGTLTTNKVKVEGVLKVLQSQPDDDWVYKLKDCKNGFYGIDVYDENGILVQENATFI